MTAICNSEQRSRPILFSAPMVRAILDRRKTQTRRIVKVAKVFEPDFGKPIFDEAWVDTSYLKPEYGNVPCLKIPFDGNGREDMRTTHRHFPFCDVGDRLWVRETFCVANQSMRTVVYRATNENRGAFPWKPSIHMPRWASRITLEITKLRVERLQDISEEDAKSEGVTLTKYLAGNPFIGGAANARFSGEQSTHRVEFRLLWDSINGKGAWEQNPWVWVIEFRKLEAA